MSKESVRMFFVIGLASVCLIAFNTAQAAITESGPAISRLMENQTVGGGAIIPAVSFLLTGDGTDTLTKVGVVIRASSTMTTSNELLGVALHRESGTKAGFQFGQDPMVGSAYVANPAAGTLTLLQVGGSGYVVPSTPTEFYIVASTSATAAIVNGDGFDIQLQANYASTTVAGGVGTAFLAPDQKVALAQTSTLKISEVQFGAPNVAGDEWIELYNTGEFPVNLQALPLGLHIFDAAGSSSPKALTYYNKIIPGHGYFLITSQTSYSGTVMSDAFYDSYSGNTLIANGGLSIATTTIGTQATSTSIDYLGWDAQPAGNCESQTCANPAPDLAVGQSLERKAQSGSTAASHSSGGPDQFKGNGYDSGDNNADFFLQTSPNPQNTASPQEFPFGGGGGGDSGVPTVLGSWPSDGMTGIPLDLSYIGFNFSEPMATTSGLISTTATTSVTLKRVGSSTFSTDNLCASIAYISNPSNYEPEAKCNLTAQLLAGASYAFEAGTTTNNAAPIRDLAGNQLDQNSHQAGFQSYLATFTASSGGGGSTQTNTIPPSVIGTTPFSGSFNIPINISKIFIKFNQSTINSSTLNAANIGLVNSTAGSTVDLSGSTFSFNSTTSVATVTLGSNLSANSRYMLTIGAGVQNNNGISLASSFSAGFETGAGADTSAPAVLGTMPISNGAANVPVNTTDFVFVFDDHLDMSTASSGSVILSDGTNNIPGTVEYDPVNKELHFAATSLLPTGQNSMTFTLTGASIKNISGVYLGSNYTMTFGTEGSNSDSQAPSIIMANADEFGISVTFNEAVKSADATALGNYSVVYTPSGGTEASLSLSAMAGHSITYDAQSRTAKISGAPMPSGSSFTVTASGIRDISGNQMTSSQFTGTVQSAAASGGFIDPGMSSNMGMVGGPPPTEFTSGTQGAFMPGANIMVMNNFVSASSTYGFELPISSQIPASGTIVITFPSSADFGLCCVATSSANMLMLNDTNKDINGPGSGTIGIKTISTDTQAKTITLTIDTATRSESMGGTTDTHDFLRFGLTDIKNPSIPKGPDSSGYSLDIKTRNASGALLESGFSTNPVYIGGGGFGGMATTTIQGQVLSAYDGTTGLNGITMMLHSPVLGPMPRSVSTSNSGNFSFTNLPINNDYYLFMEPIVSPSTVTGGGATTTGYFGAMEPSPTRATSTSLITRNITLTATTSAVSMAIKLTASANTFTATEKIDVFAGGPGSFTVQTVTPGASALTSQQVTSLPIPAATSSNGMWFVGVGPGMPKDGMMMGPPPSPNWVMPKPLELNMSGCPSSCSLTEAGVPKTEHTFTISAASQTISGIVKDASGTVISDAMVFAYSPAQMMGAHGQTDTAGKFSLNVAQGVYNVGAFFPGMGNSKEVSVEVDSSNNMYVDGSKTASTRQTGANPFILRIKRPAYTITGRVSDGTNTVANAPVFAYRTDGPGHADAMTDTSGNYTLYVDNGAWKVNAHIPGYGIMTEQSVTISGANQSNINFAPSSATTYWNIEGIVYESSDADVATSTEGVAGVMVVAKRGSSFYQTKTSSDDAYPGTYTLRVPEGNNYTLEAFSPTYGRIAVLDENLSAIGSFNVTGTTTKRIRINTRQTVTINIKDSSGNFLSVPKAYIDLFDIAQNLGNHADIVNGTTTSLQIPNGASTTIRAFIPSIPPNSITIASDDANNTLVLQDSNNNYVLEVNGSETVKVVVNASLRTISGTVYHTSAASGNELKDVWVEVVDSTNGMHYGVSATSTAGTYSIKLADGTYTIVAIKPGYIMTPQSLTVSANATQNLVMASASLTISGTITAGGSAAANAFVWAKKVGGGFTGAQADASGNYSLAVDSGTWRVFAASDKYSEGAYSGNPLSVASSQTGINIALSSSAGLQNELITSATFKDTASGSFEDSTVKTRVVVGSGALGQGGSDSYLTVKETANYPSSPSVTVIADKAKDINAYSGGSQVKNLSTGKKATVELTYTTSELSSSGIDTPAEVSQLKVSTLNEQKEWEALNTIATYKDTNGNAVAVATTSSSIPSSVTQVTFATSEATHFSAYALTSANDPSAPSTPSGVSAAAGAAGTGQITISWGASSGATGYYIYRDTSSGGSFALLADAGNVTTYTNSGLTLGTTYFYKIGAYKSGGSIESAASSAVSAAPQAVSGGGVISGGGGGSAPTVPPQVQAPAPAVPEEVAAVAPGVVEEVGPPVGISPIFTKVMKKGMSNPSIKRLQQLLNSDPDTQVAASGAGSPGQETEYFGSLTRQAVQKFQKKYGIVSQGTEETTGFGLVGPATRVKLAEVFSQVQPTAPAAAQPSPAAVSVSPVFASGLEKGMSNSDAKRLQQLLNSDPDTQVAASGAGSPGNETNYFGSLTEKAVQKFQVKYGVAGPGDAGYGYVGPKTRAKLQEVFRAVEEVEPPTVESLRIQINQLMEQARALQAEIEAKIRQ